MTNMQIVPSDKAKIIQEDISKIEAEAAEILIIDEPGLKMATEVLGKVKSRMKRLDEVRAELVGPFANAVKMANDWFKTQSAPLQLVEGAIKNKMGEYAENEEKKAREAQEKADAERKKAEEEVKEAEAKGEEVAPLPDIVPAEKPKVSMQTESGRMSTAKIWTYDVVDEVKVPRKFLKIDSAAITAAIRAGDREIAGLKIFQKTSVRMT